MGLHLMFDPSWLYSPQRVAGSPTPTATCRISKHNLLPDAWNRGEIAAKFVRNSYGRQTGTPLN